MFKKLLFGAILLIATDAYAACTTVDRSAWTQYQKNMTYGVANILYFEAGEDIRPTVDDATDEICFAGSTLDVPTIINETTILNRLAADDAVRDAALVAEIARQDEFTSEISVNDVCDKELSVIDSYLDGRLTAAQTQLDAANNNAEVKAHLRDQLYPELVDLFKKVARCVRSRAR